MPVQSRRAYALTASPLFGLRGKNELARALKCEADSIEKLRDSDSFYRLKERETKPGKIRLIEDPPNELKRIQARISKLLMRIVPPDFLYCPVRKRGAIDCAQEHFGAPQVWSLDIKEYFPSTPREFIFRFFKDRLKCAGDIACVLTDLTCFRSHLPTGAPSSPILAYFAHEKTWTTIAAACVEYDCKNTLWIDDHTVSGERVPKALQWRIETALRAGGLRYHKLKFTHGRHLIVTGNVVGQGKFELPYAFYRGLRHTRRLISRSALEDRSRLRETLQGKIQHAKTFSKKRAVIFDF